MSQSDASQFDEPRVLVIEDDPSTLSLVSTRLTMAGYVCSLAETLAEGIAFVQSSRFAAVLLDLRLPDGDGLDLMPVLKAHTPAPPVIVMTAHGVELAEQAEAAGASAFLVKPVSRQELLMTLQGVIARSAGGDDA